MSFPIYAICAAALFRLCASKGCFIRTTPVRMADGSSKQLQQVQIGDEVASWDESAQKLASSTVQAKVIGIDIFPAKDLMELTYNVSRGGARELASGSKSELGSHSLVLTKDHPIWSADQQHLVSMAPDVTKALYGLSAKQLKAGEKLRHHTGEHVPAEARPWQGNTSHVMTLRLDTHHWFYANGILVHNKGGGGRSSSGGSRSSGSSGSSSKVSVSRTRSTMGTRSYVGFIFISSGSRRRYGTYHQEPGSKCTLQSPAHIDNSCKNFIYNSNVGSNFFLDSNCQRTESDPARAQLGLETKQICIDANLDESNTDCHCCHTCMACTTQACVDAIKGPETGGCEEFLADVYSQCTDEEDGEGSGIIGVIVGIVFCIGIALCCCYACRSRCAGSGGSDGDTSVGELFIEMQTNRANLQPFCCKGDLAMQLNGTYQENGETKPTSYNLTIMSGRVGGTAQDDDGQAQVNGTVNWIAGEEEGTIMWLESNGQISLEAQGSLSQTNDGMFVIESSYVSSYQGTRGTTRVMSAPVPIPVTQGSIVQGTVVGVPANELPGQPREGCEEAERPLQATVVSVPGAVAAPVPQTMQVQCPQDSGPGSTIQLTTPAGQAIQVQVPAGVQPGAVFTIQY